MKLSALCLLALSTTTGLFGSTSVTAVPADNRPRKLEVGAGLPPGSGTVQDPFRCPPVPFDSWILDFKPPIGDCIEPGDQFELNWTIRRDPSGKKTLTKTTAVAFWLVCFLKNGEFGGTGLTFNGHVTVPICATAGRHTMTVIDPAFEDWISCGIRAFEATADSIAYLALNAKTLAQIPSSRAILAGKGFSVEKKCISVPGV